VCGFLALEPNAENILGQREEIIWYHPAFHLTTECIVTSDLSFETDDLARDKLRSDINPSNI
jgi:hypothetical protein